MLDQQHHQGPDFGCAEPKGNFARHIGLAMAPVVEREFSLEQMGSRAFE